MFSRGLNEIESDCFSLFSDVTTSLSNSSFPLTSFFFPLLIHFISTSSPYPQVHAKAGKADEAGEALKAPKGPKVRRLSERAERKRDREMFFL